MFLICNNKSSLKGNINRVTTMIAGQPGENAGSQEYLVYIACAAFF